MVLSSHIIVRKPNSEESAIECLSRIFENPSVAMSPTLQITIRHHVIRSITKSEELSIVILSIHGCLDGMDRAGYDRKELRWTHARHNRDFVAVSLRLAISLGTGHHRNCSTRTSTPAASSFARGTRDSRFASASPRMAGLAKASGCTAGLSAHEPAWANRQVGGGNLSRRRDGESFARLSQEGLPMF